MPPPLFSAVSNAGAFRRFASLLAVILVPAACAFGGDQSGTSPSGKLRFATSGTKPKTITILPVASPTAGSVLATVNSDYVKVFFSPDETWIAVKEFTPRRLKGGIHLFKLVEGTKFEPVASADVGAALEDAVVSSIRGLRRDGLESDCSVIVWSADSKAILFGLSGSGHRGRTPVAFGGWFAVYDVTKNSVGFDLKAHPFDLAVANRGAADLKSR